MIPLRVRCLLPSSFTIATAIAITLASAVFQSLAQTQTNTSPAPIALEAEKGVLTGTSVSTSFKGYSGTGYVTGFDATGDFVRWNFSAVSGLYNLSIRYRTPYGQKGFAGTLNGTGFSGMFLATSAYTSFDVGLVELAGGTNVLEIGGGWNWYEIDKVDLAPATPPAPPLPVDPTPVDPKATPAARALLKDLAADYGTVTWSGQYNAAEIPFILQTTGQRPAIVAGDFIDYSPSRVAFAGIPADYTEKMIALEKTGYVLSMNWHWNAPTNLLNTQEQPWYSGFYTAATTFDVAAALANTNSTEYTLLLRDMDAIATQLKKFDAAGIPLLWRPLHESEGAWFWWGAKGPEAFKTLWRLLFDRIVNHHGLHNLVWVLSSEDPAWYPGNDVVDIIGVDGYPPDRTDVLYPNWQALKKRLDGVKLIALSEFGGVPDIERMHRFGVWWCYFAPWSGTYGPSSMPTNTVQRIYRSAEVVSLEEINANALPPRFSVFQMNGLGIPHMHLEGRGPRGANFNLLISDDPALPAANWQSLRTGVFSGGVFSFDDPAGSVTRRFYRLKSP